MYHQLSYLQKYKRKTMRELYRLGEHQDHIANLLDIASGKLVQNWCVEMGETVRPYKKKFIPRHEIPVQELKPVKKKRANASKRIDGTKAWKILRLEVIRLAEGLCTECKQQGHAVHHVLSVREFPELQHEISNLIFLCKPCHRLRHPALPDCLFR